MKTFLDFEKPIAELEGKIEELKQLSADKDDKVNIEQEIAALEAKVDRKLKEAYAKLSPWQKTQVARHPNRPHFNDYVHELIEDFTPLAGDRAFADDQAIMGGLGRFRGQSVLVIGHEKGNDTASRIKHNFGMARPEGYRKAIRLMGLAERFKLPVLTLIDTTGAYPGIGAEERGQAEAIARSTQMCLELGVPVVATVIGEGGSGGAVALAAGNRVLMMENAVYSVISPEGCASILWRTADKAAEAAKAMRITAADLKELNVIDEVVAEPVGGAHRDPKSAIHALGEAIDRHLRDLRQHSPQALKEQRAEKFLAMGTLGGA